MALSSQSPALHNVTALSDLKELRVAIISTEWNETIVAELIAGAKKILSEHDTLITYDLKVPGAIELSYACNLLADTKENLPEAIIIFGAVIRGGTPHFDYVCQSVTQGITYLNATGTLPIIFGVFTLDNEVQAWERLGGIHGHKGEEAAIAALKMIALKRALSK